MTGIVLTTPGGNRFWYPCPDAKTGFREMSTIPYTYGAAWKHPETTLEFGTDDGTTFTASEVIHTGWAPLPTTEAK